MTCSTSRRLQRGTTGLRAFVIVVAVLDSLLIAQLSKAGSSQAVDTTSAIGSNPSSDFVRQVVVDDAAGYVFIATTGGLLVRDLSGAPVANSITLGAVDALAVSADGTRVYATQAASHAIDEIDTSTLTIARTFATAASVYPRSLSLAAPTLWFGYDDGSGSPVGAIGAVSLGVSTPVVSAPVTITNASTRPDPTWSGAPIVLAPSNVPGTLFVASSGVGQDPLDKMTIAGSSLTFVADSLGTATPGGITGLAVTHDGADVIPYAHLTGYTHRFKTSDLSDGGSSPDALALAVAPDDGRLAVGTDAFNKPAVYTYDAAGNFVYQYAYQDGAGVASNGLAFNATGGTLYAITASYNASSSDFTFHLHVITNTHDTARPPAPDVFKASPSYRSIDLVLQRKGQYTKDASYTIYRGSSPDQLAPLQQFSADGSGQVLFTDHDVAAGVTYFYAATASNAIGESDRTPVVSAKRNERVVVWVAGNDSFAYYTDGGTSHAFPFRATGSKATAISPDGTKFAYEDAYSSIGKRIAVVPFESDYYTSPTYISSGIDSQPTWSPDGSRLAFTRTTSTGTSIWTASATGGGERQVPNSVGDSAPAWSPNGALLAVTHGSGTTSTVDVISLDGGYRRTVMGTNGTLPADKCVPLTGGGTDCHYSGGSASWSPDGTRLVFVQSTHTGGNAALVSSLGGTVDYSLWQPQGSVTKVGWSPDDARIVYGDTAISSPVAWAMPEVVEVNPDGTGRNVIATYGAAAPSISAPRSAYVPLADPSAVTITSAGLANHGVTLRWIRNADTAFVVVRRSGAGGAAPTSPTDGGPVYAGTASSATATGLVNGAAYRFSIFSFSALGDLGSSASVAATPAATPMVSPNGSVLGALYAGGPRFTTTWGGSLPATLSYDVEIGVRLYSTATRSWSSGIAWQRFVTATRATHAVINGHAGTTYYIRARIRDTHGHVTAWSANAVDPVPYDDTSAATSAGWTGVGSSGHFANTVHVSSTPGAALQWHVAGSAFTLVADRCSQCGAIKVYVDGVQRAIIDTYSSTTRLRSSVWTIRYSRIGTHTVRLVVSGTAGRPSVRLDGLMARR